MAAAKAVLTEASTDAVTPAMALDSALLTEESTDLLEDPRLSGELYLCWGEGGWGIRVLRGERFINRVHGSEEVLL